MAGVRAGWTNREKEIEATELVEDSRQLGASKQRVLRIRLDRFCLDSLGVLAFGTLFELSRKILTGHRLLVTGSLATT